MSEQLVEVRYGGKNSRRPYYETDGHYAYRVPDGLKVSVGMEVEVPPTSRTSFRGGNPIATIVSLESDYLGPTHAIIRKHKHRFVLFKRCGKCGEEREA